MQTFPQSRIFFVFLVFIAMDNSDNCTDLEQYLLAHEGLLPHIDYAYVEEYFNTESGETTQPLYDDKVNQNFFLDLTSVTYEDEEDEEEDETDNEDETTFDFQERNDESGEITDLL